jgi:hypothetical protein
MHELLNFEYFLIRNSRKRDIPLVGNGFFQAMIQTVTSFLLVDSHFNQLS